MTRILRTLLALAVSTCLAAPAHAQSANAAALKTAYEKRAQGDWDAAKAAARGHGVTVIEWHRLRAGVGNFSEYRSFLSQHADWPGLPLLARKGEAAISDTTPARDVIDYLTAYPPGTGQGALRLIHAYERSNARSDAEAQAVLTWHSLSLTDAEEAALLARYSKVLIPQHEARIAMLLGESRFDEAARLAPQLPAGWGQLVEATRMLAKDEDGVDAAIEAIPSPLASAPALGFERMAWRSRKGRVDDAVTLMLQYSTSREALGEPERWGDRRRALARQMMRDGKSQIAYVAAARHYLQPDEKHYSDLEWLSGYIALRFLNDPSRALDHFNRFRLSVGTPISLGRAGYWEGRALEAMGATEDARAAYVFGAQFQTSFYGLLAAERAGVAMDPALAGEARFDDYTKARFMNSSVLQSALLLHEAGELPLAARFMRHLGESLSPQELGQLGDLALDKDPYLALLVAKFAADQGIVLNRAYFPLGGLQDTPTSVAKELALSIARRESEFYSKAQSHVGASGLMQLMPGTGADMARKLGIEDFEADDLFDPALNIRLGSAFLEKLIEDYGANIPLVTAGYNAGPTRANRWIERYGDPRSSRVNVVDWIEHIPFRETRNYVMRVAESIPAYRARLEGTTRPITLSKDLQAR